MAPHATPRAEVEGGGGGGDIDAAPFGTQRDPRKGPFLPTFSTAVGNST